MVRNCDVYKNEQNARLGNWGVPGHHPVFRDVFCKLPLLKDHERIVLDAKKKQHHQYPFKRLFGIDLLAPHDSVRCDRTWVIFSR